MSAARGLGALVAVALVLVGCAPASSDGPSASPSPSLGVTSAPAYGVPEPSDGRAPAGWRLESSLGVKIAVPASWSRNDYGCAMSAQPTVEHWRSDERDCGRVEPPDKDVAVIYVDGYDYDVRDRTLPSRPVVIGGAPGTRAEGRIADGRYEAWVLVPTDPPVVVVVRTREATVAQQIIDSVRLVDPDHNGCPRQRPARPSEPPTVAPPRGEPFVAAPPTEISVCLYGPAESSVIRGSGRLRDEAAAALVTLLNATPPGRNPDVPATECQVPPAWPELVLLLRTGEQTTTVWITYGGCTGRGMDDGTSAVQVTRSVLDAVLRDVRRRSSGWNGDLPA
jgi:hypothetical protein